MLCVSETDPITIPYQVSDGDSGINQETIISVESVPKNAAKIQTLQPVRNAKFPFISYGYKIQEQVILAITIGRTKTRNNRVKTQSWTIKTFLFGAFLVKSARLLQWLVFFVRPQSSPCMYHFLVQTLIALGVNPTRQPESFCAFAKPDETEGFPLSIFFGTVRLFSNFFRFQTTPSSILQKSLLVVSGVECHIQTFDVISKLYCVLVRRRRRFENRSFHENVRRVF